MNIDLLENSLSSYPYISGNMFFLMSDYHIIKDNYPVIGLKHKINPLSFEKLRDNDIIFIQKNMVSHFFKNFFSGIDKKVILISTNGDNPIGDEYNDFINDEKIISWWVTNNISSNEKIKTIPIGLNNPNYEYENNPRSDISLFNQIKDYNPVKNNSALLNFNIKSNKIHRKEVYNFFNGKKKYKYTPI